MKLDSLVRRILNGSTHYFLSFAVFMQLFSDKDSKSCIHNQEENHGTDKSKPDAGRGENIKTFGEIFDSLHPIAA